MIRILDPLVPPRVDVKTDSKEDIVALFERLSFRDSIGHPLTHCLDFTELMERISP